MKFIIFFLLGLSFQVTAKELLASNENRAIGGTIGNVWGVVYQLPYRDANTLSFNLGTKGKGLVAFGDVYWHQPEFQDLKGVKPFLGTGAGVMLSQGKNNDNVIAVRAPLGVKYHLEKNSIDLQGEAIPMIDTSGSTNLLFQIGLVYIY